MVLPEYGKQSGAEVMIWYTVYNYVDFGFEYMDRNCI